MKSKQYQYIFLIRFGPLNLEQSSNTIHKKPAYLLNLWKTKCNVVSSPGDCFYMIMSRSTNINGAMTVLTGTMAMTTRVMSKAIIDQPQKYYFWNLILKWCWFQISFSLLLLKWFSMGGTEKIGNRNHLMNKNHWCVKFAKV